jgi:hypothetical protein
MRSHARVLAAAALASAAIAGCGSTGDRTPSMRQLPLPSGSRVVLSTRQCNPGSNAYCALELVVRSDRYPNSIDFAYAETRLLRRHGWTHSEAPTGIEHAAHGPGNRLQVVYASAASDLEAIDLGWIDRARPVALALSHALFHHISTLSIYLQFGAG